jgi:3D (Asp-Asp-Asp) domain-containing protein
MQSFELRKEIGMSKQKYVSKLNPRVFVFLTALAIASSCAGLENAEAPESRQSAVLAEGHQDNFQLTVYTLTHESNFKGLSDYAAQGITGLYRRDFLCSGTGVAMEGTGVSLDGKYIHYVTGGGGWCGGYAYLCDCARAQFEVVFKPTGASGRVIEDDRSIAVDPDTIPLGWSVWIDTAQKWFRADDTGGLIKGKHIDVYSLNMNVNYGTSSGVYITSVAHASGDPSPYPVNIKYNGVLLAVQGQMLEAGTTYAPLRPLAEQTGHTVTWVNGVTSIDGRVYPQDQIVMRGSASWTKVRDLAAFLNQTVSWDSVNGTISLGSGIVSSIVGFVRPDFWVSGNPTSLLAGFQVQADGTAVSATTDAAGRFQLALPAGRYDIVVSKQGYLTRRVQQFATGSASLGTAAKPLDMWVGDFVADGAINMSDIMEVAKYFNSVKGDGTYVESRDVNADTAINMSDIMLISRHMNTVSTDYAAYTP